MEITWALTRYYLAEAHSPLDMWKCFADSK
jgi:hypothetical protein